MENSNAELFGSIHTHFEDQFDTFNDLSESLKEFGKLGAKKVAATGHGVFSEYEDLVDAANALKGSGVEVPDIIPGVECYFGDTKAHMVLIAKDAEGYKSLSRIITDANRNYVQGYPIVTMENLKKNVAKGHIVATSACVGGILGQKLGMDQYNAKRPIAADSQKLAEIKDAADEAEKILAEWEELSALRKPPKAEFNKLKKSGDLDAIAEFDKKLQEYNQAQDRKIVLRPKKDEAKKLVAKRDGYIEKIEEASKNINENYNEIILKESIPEALAFIDVFGKDDFYFEIQNHGLPFEKTVYRNIISLALTLGMEDHFVASNDVHICKHNDGSDEFKNEVEKRRVSRFIRFGKYDQSIAPREDDDEYGIKTNAELEESLKDLFRKPNGELIQNIKNSAGKVFSLDGIIKTAIGNIEGILSQCQIELEKGSYYPKFCDNENEEFERLVMEGVKDKFPNGFPSKEYEDRLAYEIGVIKQMGYAGYHLIVQDYLKYGRLLGYLKSEDVAVAPLTINELEDYVNDKYENDPTYALMDKKKIGMGIGPGRGSAAGSLCCYMLGITDIDPIKYDLLFERFLNVERVSMPDIDSDFKTDIRGKVYEYTKARYGEDCVCNIMTKTYASGKKNLQTASRYLASKKAFDEGLEKADAEALAKKYVAISKKLSKVYATFEKGKSDASEIFDAMLATATSEEKEVISLAKMCDGMFTGYGQHAAGVIISSTPLDSIIPTAWNSSKETFQTQCTMAQAEAKGLLKMDQLGLKNLDIITEIIAEPTNATYDDVLLHPSTREKVIDDPTIYKDIFASGLTQGVFQFESDGMKKMLEEFQPESFEDLILLVSAYRPGPMDYIPEMTAAKWHEKDPSRPAPKKSISLENDTLNDILSKTYGVPLYQEQIMRIFQDMAGYSLGGADIVRRYMSKKKMDKLMHEKEVFIHGDASRGIPGAVAKQGITEAEAGELFDKLLPFGNYGFNKSHATAYALVSFYTAYLKKYHTADFFRSSLNAMDAVEKYEPYFSEAEKFGIKILPPSIKNPSPNFSVENGNQIRFGISKIKGVGNVDFIPAYSVEEFVMKNPGISMSVIDSFAKLGMFYGRTAEEFAKVKAAADASKNWRPLVPCAAQVSDFVNAYGKQITTLSQTEAALKSAEAAAQLNEDEISMAELEKATRAYNNARAKAVDYELDAPRQTNADEIKKRGWENELLGSIVNTTQIVAELRNTYGNQIVTLADAKVSNIDNRTGEKYTSYSKDVHLAVLSQGDPITTKSGLTFYPVVLIDANGEKIERRFSEPLDITRAAFTLPSDKEKYWKGAKPVQASRDTEDVVRTARGGIAAPIQNDNYEPTMD